MVYCTKWLDACYECMHCPRSHIQEATVCDKRFMAPDHDLFCIPDPVKIVNPQKPSFICLRLIRFAKSTSSHSETKSLILWGKVFKGDRFSKKIYAIKFGRVQLFIGQLPPSHTLRAASLISIVSTSWLRSVLHEWRVC